MLKSGNLVQMPTGIATRDGGGILRHGQKTDGCFMQASTFDGETHYQAVRTGRAA